MHKLCLLGATGSIGTSTLAVLREQPDRFQLTAVTAHRNVEQMRTICEEFQPEVAVMVDEQAARDLAEVLKGRATQVLSGAQAVADVAAASNSDTVMAAIVGGAGLVPTFAAVTAGKRVLLANKEALVMSGQLFIDAAASSGAQILPVDSEHNAIFQCLPAEVQQQLGHCDLSAAGIHKILLTGSGGPFRELPLAELAAQTPAAACAHPNWDMGQKISVDSATMMNKGLEYIEARWLFNCNEAQLDVVLHPQSVIHSMVSYKDGSVLAQMGQPDMRTPIAHCLSFPERIESGVAPLDFLSIGQLNFAAADSARYPCLELAMQACWQGQWATTTLNAANEVAVAAYLAGQIKFTGIASVCRAALEQIQQGNNAVALNSIAAILSLDEQARAIARERIKQVEAC
ncbi:1-deoxy-D-xylulose-5-phosphate reductoisomerase [Pseudidiomarina terrestris]|uniref:1-deoxy-D-xylulose 5-phosphate reductoisomerase n=1 Tax=Pseudidiomarina terrestris TaxID=2820060 RepID=A0AAW7QXS8_9GAMM|nr:MULTISPECIES: 1-deoxy-D-xylulose-5-phosphate reductoisomerase [unclassified Pseudidiomarina]MDN7123557.1 1-deoxy-D-xylulose-5-phosphate reductoisomerase [Pseudidiomarina sp. 1APP75-32.1]MDN7126653.1 1-deoxy-D-xylulose-5-phosphate reductoisomerase [Pseudidiomarina sp. 1APR75-33.1]MDN7128719.1 1-deoxy-D-xylulose-5-phosphate reductoisomerase [Pseudidiomarina sp. 1APR75-15]MDN7135022.1 1-deoxy-D-xylulose-5-phosphate reductoisomerase [Pseudidiomarina sp. 1ASP75-5]MEA3587199.1 1-deoxy-D-xylulose-